MVIQTCYIKYYHLIIVLELVIMVLDLYYYYYHHLHLFLNFIYFNIYKNHTFT